MIAFDYEGKSYVVDFKREKRVEGYVHQLHEVQPPSGTDRIYKTVPVYTTYPDTIVIVREMVPEKTSKEWPIRWQATARFCAKDTFSLEAGRVHALRKLVEGSADFPIDAAKAIWDAYNGRYRKNIKPSVQDKLKDIVDRLERLQKDSRIPKEAVTLINLSFRSLRHKLDTLRSQIEAVPQSQYQAENVPWDEK